MDNGDDSRPQSDEEEENGGWVGDVNEGYDESESVVGVVGGEDGGV
jgi:hypothetical protein